VSHVFVSSDFGKLNFGGKCGGERFLFNTEEKQRIYQKRGK
jgi:hypothetical protein